MKPGTCVWKAFAVAIVLVGIAGDVAAQDYPSRAITVVVPFPPGGASDVVARIITNQMSKILGQSIIIENVSGAGGTVMKVLPALTISDEQIEEGLAIILASVREVLGSTSEELAADEVPLPVAVGS